MKENPWIQILFAAVSAYYFGYLYGRKETLSGMQPGQVIIDGQAYVVPQNVYNTISGLVGYSGKSVKIL